MTWDQLSINKPHLVYIILGGFTSLFMLCSSVIKERLYIGEATVATLCGIIFGPHAANLINPDSWGNVDQITEEFSRIVLVVQCFAVGVELPKAYMERHWRSVTFLLVPVMTFGWLITSLFIWGLFTPYLNWLDSLTIAACVTATDPVLASSVVGKGKFAKRVPKHLRDLLSAESGCNDGMAFPFIYLALYILRYAPNANEVAFHWFCLTILYECVFGAVYGFLVGYAARRMIRYAHEHNLIDRESFLVFYFVLALFCAGSGSILGIDDLLVGFACGVGFSNDGWFTEETEETHVSNVIDLLINLTFFVYFGTIIPWQQYNSGVMGLEVWRLVVIGILVLLFRRIPIMMALKPLIPDVKTWREALFAGHFGPIGVGAIFVAILARAELETESTTPLKELPPDGTVAHTNVIYLVWPIVTFLVICSILVHGSSIAVFTLGKRINTLSLTLSYTQGNEQGTHWMDRLPRIQSRSKSSMSMQRSDSEFDEKQLPPPGMLAVPGTFLRRQKEEDNPSRTQSRASSRHRSRRSRNWDSGRGPGGPISQSAIAPARTRQQSPQRPERSDSDTIAVKNEEDSNEKISDRDSDPDREADDENGEEGEIFEEGAHTIYEDSEGNVLAVERKPGQSTGDAREEFERREGRRLMRKLHHYEHADAAQSRPHDKADEAQHVADDVAAEDRGRSGKPAHAKESHKSKDTDSKAQGDEAKQSKQWREGLTRVGAVAGLRRRNTGDVDNVKSAKKTEKPKETRGPAHAYQYGNTIIVEDQDGEVIKKYDIPGPSRKQMSSSDHEKSHNRITNMSKMLLPRSRHDKASPGDADDGSAAAASGTDSKRRVQGENDGKSDDDDQRVRFTLAQGGRRLSKAEFIDQIRSMDPRSRAEAVENSDVPEPVKREARRDLREHARAMMSRGAATREVPVIPEGSAVDGDEEQPPRKGSAILQHPSGADSDELELVDSDEETIPFHNVSAKLRKLQEESAEGGETAAERRRRKALEQPQGQDDSDDDGTERVPPQPRHEPKVSSSEADTNAGDTGETQAERRRREGALGIHREGDESDSEDDNQPRQIPPRQSIRFADDDQHAAAAATAAASSDNGRAARHSALRWGKNIGR